MYTLLLEAQSVVTLQDANFRTEADTFGPLKVPKNKYYGAQTQRYAQRDLFTNSA